MEIQLLTHTMNNFLCLFLLLIFSCEAKTLFFLPPPEWKMIDQKETLVAFGENSYASFPSRISLTEHPCSNQKDWVKQAVNLHNTSLVKTCEDLGTIETKSGLAHLLQIEEIRPFGKITILQCILFDEQKVFLLTGATLKESAPKTIPLLIAAFESIQLINSVVDLVSKEALLKIESLYPSPNLLVKHLKESHLNLGEYFPVLLLKPLGSPS